MVDGAVLHLALAGALALELLVEGEHGFLRAGVDVASAAAAAAELGGAVREAGLEDRCWAVSGGSLRGLRGFEGVSCAATAGVKVGAGGGVGFGDAVSRWHF